MRAVEELEGIQSKIPEPIINVNELNEKIILAIQLLNMARYKIKLESKSDT